MKKLTFPKPKIPTKPQPIETPTWDLFRDGVTQGLLSQFLLCPEKLRLGYKVGLTPIRTGGALAFGSLVHDVLDQLYTAAKRKGAANDWNAFVNSYLTIILKDKEKLDRDALNQTVGVQPEEIQSLEENYALADGVLPGYLRKWMSDFQEMDWVALEEKFSTPIDILVMENDRETQTVRNIKIRGKRDGVFRSRKSGQLWLFETKTKGRIDEDSIMDRITFDLQVMLYLWSIWKDYGEVPAGVIYNIIRNPQLKQKKTESLLDFKIRIRKDTQERPEFYFLRYQSHITKNDLEKFEVELKSIIRQLYLWVHGDFHWKNSAACSMGGVNCQFLPVCARGDKMRFTLKTEVFPELSEVH